MAKTLKYTDAGGIQVAALYDRCTARDTPAVRAAKHKASSEAQRKLNQKASWWRLMLMLAKNFPTAGSGLVVVLTHDDDHMPKSRREAQRRFKYFLQKYRDARRADGLPEPVVFWAPEVLTSRSGRWHQHVVLDNTGDDYDRIRRCWIYGADIEIKPLRVDDEKNHETLARYMTKELREAQEYESRPGLHGWSCTRSALKPETEAVTVEDDYQLTPPQGAAVILDEGRATQWASWRLIVWRFGPQTPPPRARRRRRR